MPAPYARSFLYCQLMISAIWLKLFQFIGSSKNPHFLLKKTIDLRIDPYKNAVGPIQPDLKRISIFRIESGSYLIIALLRIIHAHSSFV